MLINKCNQLFLDEKESRYFKFINYYIFILFITFSYQQEIHYKITQIAITNNYK